jgi:hypothetical protein
MSLTFKIVAKLEMENFSFGPPFQISIEFWEKSLKKITINSFKKF